MRNTITRVLAMLLCLTLTFGLCVSMVQATVVENATAKLAKENVAEAQTSNTQQAPEIAAEVAAETTYTAAGATEAVREEIEPLIYTYVNPIYGGNAEETYPEVNSSNTVATPSTYHTTLANCKKEIVNKLISRNANFEVGYRTTTGFTNSTFQTFVNSLTDHDISNPKAGDYLLWNGLNCSAKTSGYMDGSYYMYTITITASYYTTASQEQAVDTEVARLLNTLPVKGVSDYKKVKAVYDYMCKNIVYDHAGLNAGTKYCHSAHSAFIAHKTVCQGYSSMFYRMMLELGIDCRIVAGDASNYSTPYDTTDDHGWNIVKLNGKYYNLDATWDTDLYPNYEFFLVTDANFPRHQPWSQYTTSEFKNQYPKATKNFDPATDDVAPTKHGWLQEGGKWYFYNQGKKVPAGWFAYGPYWYYMDKNQAMQTGWLLYGGKWYFFDHNSGRMVTEKWVQDAGLWYYFDANGYMVTGTVTIGGKQHKFNGSGVWLGEAGNEGGNTGTNGWKQEGGKWYYYQNGTKATGWKTISGTTYYFDGNGVMKTGWQSVGGKWYYFESSGAMKTGWLELGSAKYYLKPDGSMATGTVTIDGKQHKFDGNGVWQGEVTSNGWKQEGGKWYYYENGAKATGWKTISGKTYYFDSNGAMKTGWLNLSGKYYYFNSDGVMLTGIQKIGSKYYAFKNNGEMLTGWIEDGAGNVYYCHDDGAMHFGWLSYYGEYYFFDNDGMMAIGWWEIDGEIYYFDHNYDTLGEMWHDTWITDPDGNAYYAGSDGALYRGGYYYVDGYRYYFYSDGRCSNPPYFYN